jgi:hypothetical protein
MIWGNSEAVGNESMTFDFEDPAYAARQIINTSANGYLLVGIDPSSSWYYYSQEMKITTPDGTIVPMGTPTIMGGDVLVVGFIPPPGVTEVVVTYIVRDTLPEFEFLIAPPERPPLPQAVAPPGGYGATPYSYSGYATPPYATPSSPVMDHTVPADPSLPAEDAVPAEEPMPEAEPMSEEEPVPEGEPAPNDETPATAEELTTEEETPSAEADPADEVSEPPQ